MRTPARPVSMTRLAGFNDDSRRTLLCSCNSGATLSFSNAVHLEQARRDGYGRSPPHLLYGAKTYQFGIGIQHISVLLVHPLILSTDRARLCRARTSTRHLINVPVNDPHPTRYHAQATCSRCFLRRALECLYTGLEVFFLVTFHERQYL
jgi:hypothetical protein